MCFSSGCSLPLLPLAHSFNPKIKNAASEAHQFPFSNVLRPNPLPTEPQEVGLTHAHMRRRFCRSHPRILHKHSKPADLALNTAVQVLLVDLVQSAHDRSFARIFSN